MGYAFSHELWLQIVYDGNGFDDLPDISWIGGISGFVGVAGYALMIASLFLIMNGLMIDRNLSRSAPALAKTLGTIRWIALLALILYLLYIPLTVAESFLLQEPRLAYYFSGVPFVLLWASLLVVARSLKDHVSSFPLTSGEGPPSEGTKAA